MDERASVKVQESNREVPLAVETIVKFHPLKRVRGNMTLHVSPLPQSKASQCQEILS